MKITPGSQPAHLVGMLMKSVRALLPFASGRHALHLHLHRLIRCFLDMSVLAYSLSLSPHSPSTHALSLSLYIYSFISIATHACMHYSKVKEECDRQLALAQLQAMSITEAPVVPTKAVESSKPEASTEVPTTHAPRCVILILRH